MESYSGIINHLHFTPIFLGSHIYGSSIIHILPQDNIFCQRITVSLLCVISPLRLHGSTCNLHLSISEPISDFYWHLIWSFPSSLPGIELHVCWLSPLLGLYMRSLDLGVMILLDLGSLHQQFFIKMKILLCCNPDFIEVIAAKFCTCHDSCAVMACAKICSDLINKNWITTKWIFNRIWIANKNHQWNQPHVVLCKQGISRCFPWVKIFKSTLGRWLFAWPMLYCL